MIVREMKNLKRTGKDDLTFCSMFYSEFRHFWVDCGKCRTDSFLFTNVAFPVNNMFTGVLQKCFGSNTWPKCVKTAPAVEFAHSTSVWFLSTILFVNLWVLETVEVTVAMTFQKVGEKCYFLSGEKCYFPQQNHRLKSRNVLLKRVYTEWLLGFAIL